MDALEFLRYADHICFTVSQNNENCYEVCPLREYCGESWANDLESAHRIIDIVLKWAADHPTRSAKVRSIYGGTSKFELEVTSCCKSYGYDCPECGKISCKDCWETPTNNEDIMHKE